MTTEELLKAGIIAAKAGETSKASDLLIRVVQDDPKSELGWLWLGLCRTVSEQREYCFRRVLAINPQNTEARRQLGFLHSSEVDSQTIQPLNSAPNNPAHISVPPFVEPTSSIEQLTPPQPSRKKAIHTKRGKKRDNTWGWMSVGFTFFVCAAVAGIFILGRIASLTNAPLSTLPSPTTIPATLLPPTPNYAPTFESAPCNFAKPEQAQVDCGFVILPEDRSGDLSDTIRIAVVRYRATNTTPVSDPILYLPGGPGSEAIAWSATVYDSVIAPLLSQRDFIVFDPRGVGRSQPVLACDEFGKTYLSDLQGKLPVDQKVSYYQGALLVCKNNLSKLGANLSAYTSMSMAADAKDIVRALGYQQTNLYGVSYGTRVAQLVMRHYPEIVHTAILDSVVPVETQLFNRDTTEPVDTLQVLFADCRADPACSSAYPELESVYNQVFNQLNNQPIQVTIPMGEDRKLDQSINGYSFRNAVLWALRTPQTISLVPRLIYRVRDGDNSTLLLSLTLPVLTFDSISLGSYISVNCHDQIFAMSLEELDTTIQDLCKLWDIKPPAPGENDPVVSDIPTLIFAGRYDSTTPSSFAHQIAGHLSRSYIAEIPDQGHAPSVSGLSDCPTRLVTAFLQDPATAPDLTCVQETQAIKFIVPYDASNPITMEPTPIDEYQISTYIPSGWSKANFGFYNRAGFLGDITQIGFQRAPVLPADWVHWLLTNFSGNQGFDQPVTERGQREANGLTWSIYETSSHGYPVDIAFAISGKETLLVLLVSYEDEHEALYNSVFLPILDATKSLGE